MEKIFIHEVGPRDGLQVEEQIVHAEKKIEWIRKLINSGIDMIQLGSFVNPKRVPQMADTEELFRYFLRSENRTKPVILSGLVLNEKGMERGLNCGVELFCMGVSASETHSMKNTGMSIDEALGRIVDMAKSIIQAGKQVQVSVQSAFGCGYEGKISHDKIITIINKYLEAGITNISLADTAGHANPYQTEKLISEIFRINDTVRIACHFHDTYGMAMANVWAAYKSGIRIFESSFAGLGGCPFTAIASGNVCTEDLVNMFKNFGMCNEIDLDKIIEVSKDAETFFNRVLPGIIHKTGTIKV